MKEIVSNIKEKILRLLERYDQIVKENLYLKDEIKNYKNLNFEMKKTITELNQRIDLLKMNKSNQSQRETNQTKEKIDFYVNEINKCIKLINNRSV